MSKIVLNDVTNLNTLSVINDNFDKLEQELQNKVLYRDNPVGEPNTLEGDVDANGNSLYNVQDLTIAGSFTVAGQDVGAYIGLAQVAADEAAQSATAAANSSSAAATSASAASTSASQSAASATASASSASAASSSASSAASSATTATAQAAIATTKASEASSSATAAASSATEATSQASIATTQASNAATSAAASANSATNSATSATASASSASAAAASAASAAALLDNFDDRYLGSKSTAPTLDNDGNALIAGALYFNDGTIVGDDKGMWAYDGSAWIKASSASQAILVTYEYVATAGQTTFSGNDANGVSLAYTVGSIIVTLNGVRLRPGDDYTASTGTSVVLSVAAAFNDEVVIDAFTTFDVANTYTQAQVDGFAVKLTGAQTIAGVKTFSDAPVLGSSQFAIPSGSAPSYTCRAWVNFNGTGTVAIRASGNVSSITDNGVGNYTVNFATAMPDVNYTATGMCNDNANTSAIAYRTGGLFSTTQFQVSTSAGGALADNAQCLIAIFR